jgi:hypothetical protein
MVGPAIPDRRKGRGQTNCSHWSSRFGVGRGAKDSIPEEFSVTIPWRRLRPTQGCSDSKE